MNLGAFCMGLLDGAQTYFLVERAERLSRELECAGRMANEHADRADGVTADLAGLSWYRLDDEQREALRTVGFALAKAGPGARLGKVDLLIPRAAPPAGPVSPVDAPAGPGNVIPFKAPSPGEVN